MKNPVLCVVPFVLAAVTGSARADTGEPSTLSVQAGLMPGVTVIAAEYTHVFHPNFEVAASAGIGLTLSLGVVPRIRWSSGPWRFALGAGLAVSQAAMSGGDGVYPSAVAQATMSYVTQHGRVLQLQAGAAAHCDGDAGALDCSLIEAYPIASIGLGWTF